MSMMLVSLLSRLLLRLIHAVHLTHAAAVGCVRELRLRFAVVSLPGCIPAHVGIIIEDGVQNLGQLCALLGWCATAGVRCITLCDVHGELVRASVELRAELKAAGLGAVAHLLEAREALREPVVDVAAVRVVALRTGRDDIAFAARGLCERVRVGSLPASAIDEHAVEDELRENLGFPEPVREPGGWTRLAPHSCRPLPADSNRRLLTHGSLTSLLSLFSSLSLRNSFCNAVQRSISGGCCRGIAA